MTTTKKDGSGGDCRRTRRLIILAVFVSTFVCTFNSSRGLRRLLLSLNVDETQPVHENAKKQHSTLRELLYLYESLPDAESTERPPFREVSYAYFRQKSVPLDDVTLTTQLSVSKFPRLLNLVERWTGPISCAVYLPDTYSIHALHDFVQNQTAVQDLVTFHVMLEKPSNISEYPINRLRNLALQHMETEWFFLCDVDFMPRINGHAHLLQSLAGKRNATGKYTTLYVLPAFEVLKHRGKKKNNSTVTSLKRVPKTKQDILAMLPTQKLKPFHMDYNTWGHGPTNYTRWILCPENESYPITYNWRFEPYVVGNRYGLPAPIDKFRGFGLNKVSWVAEAHLTGHQFEVLCGDFVVHMNHPGRLHRKAGPNRPVIDWFETDYLPNRYNFTVPDIWRKPKKRKRKK